MSFYVIWEENGSILRGFSNGWIDSGLWFPVAFPGSYSETATVDLYSSASASGSLENLENVKLYLTGDPDDLSQVQSIWPHYGDAFTPVRDELNGGLEISFDEGRTYNRFTSTYGLESNPSTWVTLPASTIGLGATDGVIGPFDRAKIYLRYRVPQAANPLKLMNISLGVDFDVI